VATQPFLPFDDAPPQSAAPVAAAVTRSQDPATNPPSRLIESLAEACAAHPLTEKILVAPSRAIGYQIVERLAMSGRPVVHLRVETVRTLAHAAVGLDLAREGRRLLSRVQALALIEQACGDVLTERSYFGALKDRPGLHRALQSALDELRAAGLSPADLPAGAFADSRKPRELVAIRDRYEASLETSGWIDRAEVLRRAAEKAASGRIPAASAVYFLPSDAELSVVERRFLEAHAKGALQTLAADDPSAWTSRAATARFVRALGEENEVREAFRRILTGGQRFDQVEILHTDASIYPALVFELAAEHGIPCTFSGGIAATYTRPGRAALAFLAWLGGGYEAEILRQALASGELDPGVIKPAASDDFIGVIMPMRI
jgi:hypothetical protein